MRNGIGFFKKAGSLTISEALQTILLIRNTFGLLGKSCCSSDLADSINLSSKFSSPVFLAEEKVLP
jgi:hypothetical protein